MPQVNADTYDQRTGRRQPFTPRHLKTTASRQVYKRVIETTPAPRLGGFANDLKFARTRHRHALPSGESLIIAEPVGFRGSTNMSIS